MWHKALFIGALMVALAYGCKSGGGSAAGDTGAGEAEDTGSGEASEDTGTGEGPKDTGTGPEDTGTGTETPCAGVRCDTPPENACDGRFGISISNAVGWCDRGECHYAARSEVCVGSCEEGVCTGAPCQGVRCDQPPEAECADGDTLIVFNSVGYCAAPGGVPECRYSSREVVCEEGCADSACVEAPCANVICDDPPARYCDGDDLVVWDTIPRCEDGECLYGIQTVSCGSGCEEGACVNDDPCANVICKTPPASYCADDGTLRTFRGQGTCHNGACIYLQEDLPCDGGCSEGQCADDACAGVDCGQVPALYCIDDATLASWDGQAGTCIDGVCGYGAEAVTCDGGCAEGMCIGDPCQGVVCAIPPPDRCLTETALAAYESRGICIKDSCVYDMDHVSCDDGCEMGACVGEEQDPDTGTGMEQDTGTGEEIDTDTGTGEEVDTETDTGTGTAQDTETGTDEENPTDMPDTSDSSETETDTDTTTATARDADSFTLEDGLIAYYPFNGNADDESGNGNNGTIDGALPAADRFGDQEQALEFDGESAFVDIGNDESLNFERTDAFTLAAWVNLSTKSTDDNNHFIVTKSGEIAEDYFAGYYMFVRDDDSPEVGGAVRFNLQNNEAYTSVEGITDVLDMAWHHLVAVSNGTDGFASSIRLYVDGQLESLVITSDNLGDSSIKTDFTGRIGARNSIGESYNVPANGIIDDVRIYNRALSAEEVLSLYHEGGWQTECIGQPDFTPCTVVTDPDRDYDICVNEVCVSPGCGNLSCNTSGPHFPLADTNQRECYGASSTIPCPLDGEDYYGQDAQYGWDLINSPTLRFNRNFAVVAEPVVEDTVTGLSWQGETPGTLQWTAALSYCDGLEWGGADDWRLPDMYELQSIVNRNVSSPSIDEDAFPGTPVDSFWSSTCPNSSDAFRAIFDTGRTTHDSKDNSYFVRCVRGVPATHATRFTRDMIVADEPFVTDAATGLVWQGCVAGQSGLGCDVGVAATYTWLDALAYCETLTWDGLDNWRLPNIVELQSIVNHHNETGSVPITDTGAFPLTPADRFWWTSSHAFSGQAWYLRFDQGAINDYYTNNLYYVRCVRDET